MKNEIKDRMPDNVKFVLEEINSNILRNYITNLQQLCDKYEEEHNTTFKEWQKDIQANKKAIEYINKHFEDDEGIICKIIDKHTCDANYNFLEDLIDILEGK